MKLQVLVSTMHQTDHSLLKKMNIQSDAIVINQCDINKFEEFEYKGHKIKFLSFNERGVGLSRNTALMRSDGDICIFADDDVTYVNGYKEVILETFAKIPDADVIVFNVIGTNPDRMPYIIPKQSRVRIFNCLRYGTYRIAVRNESIKKSNIYFSLLFGGGAKYSAGEDSLFMIDCIRKGLKVYASPVVIGEVNHQDSTWFNGYTDKYFMDKGVFYYSMSKRWAWLLCLQFAIRHRNLFKNKKTITEAYKLMIKGIKAFLR